MKVTKASQIDSKLKKFLLMFKDPRLPWLRIVLCLIMTFGTKQMLLLLPNVTAGIIDEAGADFNLLLKYVLFTVIYFVFYSLGEYFQNSSGSKTGYVLRTRLWDKLLHLPMCKYFSENPTNMVSRFTNDVDNAAVLYYSVIGIIGLLYSMVIGTISMAEISIRMTIYMVLSLPIVGLLTWLVGKIVYLLNYKRMQAMAATTQYMVERVSNLKLIKACCSEQLEREHGKSLFRKQFLVELKSGLLNIFSTPLSQIIASTNLIISFIFGAAEVANQNITVGNLMAFYEYSGIVSGAFFALYYQFQNVKAAQGSMMKVADFLSNKNETTEGKTLDIPNQNIVFDQVDFQYDERKVLDGISFTIPEGKVTALVGDNGSGKSTIMKLIERFYDANKGSIFFGSTNIREYNLSEWRRMIGYVSQEVPLLSGTIRENILYGCDRRVEESELIEACKKANAYDFIKAIPEGFDFNIGEYGSKLSGGQRQKLVIARIILKDPDYLLLDECTSNMDAVSEHEVMNALRKLMSGRTTLMIAHNMSALQFADYILVLEKGRISYCGKPENVIASCSKYKDIIETERRM